MVLINSGPEVTPPDRVTMTQHLILAPARFEIAGRVLLGQDPGSPVI